MNILTLEQLLQIHSIVINTTNGSAELLDIGRLEATRAMQTQYAFGEELNTGAHATAATIIRG